MNHEGVERRIEDATGHVMELVEAIKKGSGKKPQANQRKDFGVGEGLPPDNLVTRAVATIRASHSAHTLAVGSL